MFRHQTLIPFVLAGLVALFGADATALCQNKHVDVQRILDKYQTAVPGAKELGLYGLDWAPTLQAAKERAAKEKRPILLLVVHNKYGNLYTGHC